MTRKACGSGCAVDTGDGESETTGPGRALLRHLGPKLIDLLIFGRTMAPGLGSFKGSSQHQLDF